jgi:ribosomal protein S18 acetylase RimI-like enzyme
VGLDAEPMLEAIRNDAKDLSVVRVPTSRLDVVACLGRRFDSVVLTDCLVIYHRDNVQRGLPDSPSVAGLEFEEATRADAGRLGSMVVEAFQGYQNHYSANPTISQEDVVDGYREWAESFIRATDRKAIVACVDGDDAGFATLEFFSNEGHIVLNGVRPAFRGRGVYRAIVQMAVREFMKAGLPRTVISTQIDNRTVQRVWVTEGFILSRSYYTLHILQP